jgi:hypothetical protein
LRSAKSWARVESSILDVLSSLVKRWLDALGKAGHHERLSFVLNHIEQRALAGNDTKTFGKTFSTPEIPFPAQ